MIRGVAITGLRVGMIEYNGIISGESGFQYGKIGTVINIDIMTFFN